MKIKELFQSDVTRDIPPVVYFHEQSPEKLAAEVSEYIMTGGWNKDHANYRRVPNGIHEQYVRLLEAIVEELKKPGGPELPTVWISGFYGSGKSSFAKLLGLALDGVALPDGRSLAEAWLARDTSPRAHELRAAWEALRQQVDPMAVVFDVGSVARDNEHVHTAVLRQVQRRLGYCATNSLVADTELKIERDGHWPRFLEAVKQTLGKEWRQIKDSYMVEDDFSTVMHAMFPERYVDPLSWFERKAGTHSRVESPEEAVTAIRDMLGFRRPDQDTTLFLVIDEVSQYVLANNDRADRLRAFASALGAKLHGKVWLMALGQQKLDDAAGDSFLMWAKDRFPPKLRVHLAPTNISDVVHQRLLKKRSEGEQALRQLFEQHRPDLKLFAYGCEDISTEDFVDVYPLMPGFIDLLLQITSALRVRSTRAQGDDQAIRGLLQMLGELFRAQRLADLEVGELVTMDRVYEVQGTAMEADVQNTMARIMSRTANEPSGELMVRAAKAVALLELIQDSVPTTAQLVARCLYDRVDRGNNQAQVGEALERLRELSLLAYSERDGYRLQSSVGEEWEADRRDISVSREQWMGHVQEALKFITGMLEPPKLQGRPFPWHVVLSDGRQLSDVTIRDGRDEAAMLVDLRLLVHDERKPTVWIPRSAEDQLFGRLIWVGGDMSAAEDAARELQRSTSMHKKYTARRDSLNAARKMLLIQEESRAEQLRLKLHAALEGIFMDGMLYFRGSGITPSDHGAAFSTALTAAANRVLPNLFPHFITTQIMPSELTQLLAQDLSGPSTKFLTNELGILSLDGGRCVAECSGVVPQRVLDAIKQDQGLSGAALLARFGAPPYGYTANVVKACVAGLLRGGKVRIQPESGEVITAIRDAGVRDLFDKDRAFKRAGLMLAEDGDIGIAVRAKLAKMFDAQFNRSVERDDAALADAVVACFPERVRRLRELSAQLGQLPGGLKLPEQLVRYQEALEGSIQRARHTREVVLFLKLKLDALRDGDGRLKRLDEGFIPDQARAPLTLAHSALHTFLPQLGDLKGGLSDAQQALQAQLIKLWAEEEPWRDVAALDGALQALKEAYFTERGALIDAQQDRVDEARKRVKARQGFSTLSADRSNLVLRSFVAATAHAEERDATSPALAALRDQLTLALQQAEEKANERLDELLAELEDADKPKLTRKLDLNLRHREVSTEAEIDALVEEVRKRLLDQIKAGVRVRIA